MHLDIILWTLIVAVSANVVIQIVLVRRDREAAAARRLVLQTSREIHAMLSVWAETWPVAAVREQIQRAVQKIRRSA
jgi:hypothetical protein